MRKGKGRLPFLTIVTAIFLIAVAAYNVCYIRSLNNENARVSRIAALREQVGGIEFPKDRGELPILAEKARYSTELLKIIKDYRKYPQELTAFLAGNPSQFEFVKGYSEKAGHTFGSGTLDHISQGMAPLLIQWDGRWGYASLGDFCVATNGCGPTCLAMVYAALTGDNTKTPFTFSEFTDNNNYYVNEVGCKWSLMTEGAQAFGLKSRALAHDRENVLRELKNGHPIICSMKKGDFTYGGHFIVLAGATEDGRIKVNDPNSPWRSLILWDYDRISPQISSLWSFSI